jgi:hypothetical protein
MGFALEGILEGIHDHGIVQGRVSLLALRRFVFLEKGDVVSKRSTLRLILRKIDP